MIPTLVEPYIFVKRTQLSIDARANEAIAGELCQFLLEFALAPANDRRKDHHALALGQREHALQNLIDALAGNRLAAPRAVRFTDRRKEQAQVVVNLRHRADRRSRAAGNSLLLDRDCRRQAFD